MIKHLEGGYDEPVGVRLLRLGVTWRNRLKCPRKSQINLEQHRKTCHTQLESTFSLLSSCSVQSVPLAMHAEFAEFDTVMYGKNKSYPV
jgi:hypothetical protein